MKYLVLSFHIRTTNTFLFLSMGITANSSGNRIQMFWGGDRMSTLLQDLLNTVVKKDNKLVMATE
jgi:hypothetical protein